MATVEAKGLKEFNVALARVRDQLPVTAQDIALHAVQLIVPDAVSPIPRSSGRAAKSVQGFVTNEGASVTGGEGVPYFRWLAIGGASGRRLANIRRIVKPDRYINPAYEMNKERIQRDAQRMFAEAARSAGLEVTE